MKKIATLMLFLSLGLVYVGCDNKPKAPPAGKTPAATPDKPADGTPPADKPEESK